jgi:hypothetical protein
MVHDGAVEFCKDIVATRRLCAGEEINLTANDAVAGFLAFLKNPTEIDANLFKNISIENIYSGRDSLKVISKEGNLDQALAKSIWKEGAKVLNSQNSYDASIASSLVNSLIRIFSTPRKFKKFIASPELFFADSRHLIVKLIGRFLGY